MPNELLGKIKEREYVGVITLASDDKIVALMHCKRLHRTDREMSTAKKKDPNKLIVIRKKEITCRLCEQQVKQ